MMIKGSPAIKRAIAALSLLIMAMLMGTGCASGPTAAEHNRIRQYVRAAMEAGANLSPEEIRLYEMISEYRLSRGLSIIPLSPSLTRVAQMHARDLNANPPRGRCNGHTWSADGPWSSCCYTPDHAEAQCMWDKPRELTSYKGNGYEIGGIGSALYRYTPESALQGWQGSRLHHHVIINKGMWKDIKWKALGVAIYLNSTGAWFGEEPDEALPPTIGNK